MAARSSARRSRSTASASGAGSRVRGLGRLGGGELADAALERAHRLAAGGDGEPAGDGAGVVEPVEVQDRAAPGDLHDVVGVRVAEAVAAGDRVQHRVQERDEVAPRVLAAGGGLPGEMGEGERGHLRRGAGRGRVRARGGVRAGAGAARRLLGAAGLGERRRGGPSALGLVPAGDDGDHVGVLHVEHLGLRSGGVVMPPILPAPSRARIGQIPYPPSLSSAPVYQDPGWGLLGA